MTSLLNNFGSPFFTSVIENGAETNELQKEIDDLREDLDNNYYDKIESDERYLNQENRSKWAENVVGNTIYNKNNKKVGINKLTADTELDVSGTLQTKDIKITAGLIAQGTKGVADQILKTDGTNVYWGNDSGGGQGSSKWVTNSDVIYPENNKKVVVGETTIDSGFVFQTLGDAQIKGDISTNKINGTYISSDNNYNLFLGTTPQVGIGFDNILIGNSTSSNFQSNNAKNIIIGVNTDLEYNANNRMNIGDVIYASELYTSHGKIGINKYTPEESLDVSGNLKLNGGIKINNSFGNFGQVISSDGQGKVVWTDISSSSGDSKWIQSGDTIKNNSNKVKAFISSSAIGWYGPDKNNADFFNVVAWKKNAEFICNYFKKGDMIELEGYLSTSSYQDKEGKKINKTEIIVNSASFCGSKKNKDIEPEITGDEDLPF